MADENKDNGKAPETSPEPKGGALKSLKEDYRKATPKERLKKFKVDPVTKTLRRV